MSTRMTIDPAIKKLAALQNDLRSRTDVPVDVISAINELAALTEKKEAYIENMTTQSTEILKEIRKNTFDHPWKKMYEEGETRWNITPYMISGQEEVQFIKSIIAGCKAKRVLEIGLFTGYGAMAMAEALPPDGVVVSCEIDPYLVKFVRDRLEGTQYSKKINILQGPALESMMKLVEEGQQFDVVYIDADKENKSNYYEILIDKGLLAKGGVILFDNAFGGGKAYSGEKCDETDETRRTNELIRNDERVHKVMLTFKDGLYMVRRREDFGVC